VVLASCTFVRALVEPSAPLIYKHRGGEVKAPAWSQSGLRTGAPFLPARWSVFPRV